MSQTEIDVNATVAVAEKSALQTKLTLAIGAIGILMTVVNFFLTREISSTASKIDSTNAALTELSATVRIQQVRSDYQNDRLAKLEAAKEEAAQTHKNIEQRLNSLEQRAALADQYMQTTKYK